MISVPVLLGTHSKWKLSPLKLFGQNIRRLVLSDFDAGFAPEFVVRDMCYWLGKRVSEFSACETALVCTRAPGLVSPRYPVESELFTELGFGWFCASEGVL